MSTETTTERPVSSANTSGVFRLMLKRFRRGDSGMIPIVIGLLVLGAYFQIRSSVFLSTGNLTNLMVQATIFVLLGIAEVWLLLLGEIDLSAGFNAGLAGAIATILVDQQFHWSWYFAVGLALIASTAFGALWGFLVIGLRLPSFIVTLAGQLGLEGLVLWIVDSQGTGGSISIHEPVLYNIVYGDFTPLFTIIFIVGTVLALSFSLIRKNASRASRNLESVPMPLMLLRIAGLVIGGGVLIWIFNSNRGKFTPIHGMPFAIMIVGVVLGGCTFIMNKTKPGRYIYAIGGNAEAARRAGIAVNRYRLMAFMMTGLISGIAGLVYVSNLNGISDSINGGTLVLYAVAAAVIGGTSLFGGRGKMVHALIGGVVIATIYNGMALIQLGAPQQYIATALVLLGAVTIDSLARRGSTIVK
ncbi:MAG: ABC transporter permease [Actinomycetota bacterium]|nr:ABC transporter permease [Actinomycetota bacterium]